VLKFSILNAFRRKGIAVIAIIGTALGVALMTVLLSISDGMDALMTSTMNEIAGWIMVYPESAPMGAYVPSQIGFPESYIDEIKQIENVKEEVVTPLIMAAIPKDVADFGDPMGVALRGADQQTSVLLGENNPFDSVIDGEVTDIGDGEIIIGNILAIEGRAKGADYAEVGGKIIIPIGNSSVTLTVVGIFETGNYIYDGAIYTDIDTARKLMPTLAEGEINYIHVEAADIEYVESVADAIESRFANRQVPVTAQVANDLMESFEEMLSQMNIFFWIVSLVAAVAGGFSIFIVMLISVVERTKEFGILKASGWSNLNLVSSVVGQSITVGLLGSAVGLLMGYGALNLIEVYSNMDIGVITWRLVLIIVSFGVAMGIIGGLYPALRAARVSPIESLRAV
jgi:putative ABC transport system permease protein